MPLKITPFKLDDYDRDRLDALRARHNLISRTAAARYAIDVACERDGLITPADIAKAKKKIPKKSRPSP